MTYTQAYIHLHSVNSSAIMTSKNIGFFLLLSLLSNNSTFSLHDIVPLPLTLSSFGSQASIKWIMRCSAETVLQEALTCFSCLILLINYLYCVAIGLRRCNCSPHAEPNINHIQGIGAHWDKESPWQSTRRRWWAIWNWSFLKWERKTKTTDEKSSNALILSATLIVRNLENFNSAKIKSLN